MHDSDGQRENGNDAIASILESSTFELIPLKNVMDQAAFLPAGARVSLTASPGNDLETTVEVAADLTEVGFQVVPHLSAHMTRDRAHLKRLLRRLGEIGVDQAFVIGGDADQVGDFFDALQLLEAMEEIGHTFRRIGVGCYPEGHATIPRPDLLKALKAKQEYAHYMTTQMCFDPVAISEFIAEMRREDVTLPVHIGIPGVAPLRKLMTISARIGVGASVRFLSHHTSLLGKLVRPGGYAPDELIHQLESTIMDPAAAIQGFHIYTFNQVETTEAWRREMLGSLRAS